MGVFKLHRWRKLYKHFIATINLRTSNLDGQPVVISILLDSDLLRKPWFQGDFAPAGVTSAQAPGWSRYKALGCNRATTQPFTSVTQDFPCNDIVCIPSQWPSLRPVSNTERHRLTGLVLNLTSDLHNDLHSRVTYVGRIYPSHFAFSVIVRE